jgi:hypothetical protein
MPNEVADARTGELVDISALSDRDLQEAIYRQNNDIVGSLIDVLQAIGAAQGQLSELNKAAKGEHKGQDGKSMKDDLLDFRGTLLDLVSAVTRVPERTGDVVDKRFERTLIRVVGGGGESEVEAPLQ